MLRIRWRGVKAICSTEVRNNLYFCRGLRVRVYVQCLKCSEYAAWYTLGDYPPYFRPKMKVRPGIS